jgi:catechol 2,3-dioxygenase-like lactoylglutathione lyase family enzyme
MEVNGIAHIFLTASNYERSREFYSRLLSFVGARYRKRLFGVAAFPGCCAARACGVVRC